MSRDGLTPKEYDVLSRLADGMSFKFIADELGISIETVKNHAHRVYEKLGITEELGVIPCVKAARWYWENFVKQADIVKIEQSSF